MQSYEFSKVASDNADMPVVIKDGDQYYHVQSVTPMGDCLMVTSGAQFFPKSGGGTMARAPQTTPPETSTNPNTVSEGETTEVPEETKTEE